MSDLLHVRTLFAVGALTAFICTALLLILRRLHSGSESAMRCAALGLACSGLGMLCVAMRGQIPDLVSWVGASTLGPAGMFVLYEAARRLCELEPRPAVPAAATALMLGFQLWLGAAPEHHVLRLTASSLASAGAAVLILPLLVSRLGREPTRPVLGTIALTVAILLAHSARALAVQAHGVQLGENGQQIVGSPHVLAATLFVLGPMIQAMAILAWAKGRAMAELRAQAATDELTGLASRRSFFAQARQRLERPHPATALLMIDLDEFKQVNDLHGHQAGDRALAHFAAILRRTLAPDDLAGRYGGEEFCALCARSDPQQLLQIAESIRTAVLNADFEHAGTPIALSVSIGIATTHQQSDFEGLLAVADRRLYLAKSSGRNRVVSREPDPARERRSGHDRRQGPPRSPAPAPLASPDAPLPRSVDGGLAR